MKDTIDYTINEITPLSENDCFYIVDRIKSEFNFPIHRHKEYELNFIERGAGAVRIVGDSIETIPDYDLVLIGCEDLEHAWLQGECESESIREITIQFSTDIFSDSLLKRNQFDTISRLLDSAKQGIKFSFPTIMKVYSKLDSISSKKGFDQFLTILNLFYELSNAEDIITLSNTSFANVERNEDSRRVAKINNYINTHYNESIKLEELANLVGMTPPAFSRFFKIRTGYKLTEYITDIRLGTAARLLINSTMSISEICYECGFNNISNFNRRFKSHKKLTPKEFRDLYRKTKIIC